VFENRVLKMFGCKRDTVAGDGRRVHIDKHDGLVRLSSPNTIHVIKSVSLRWVGHVACMGERGAYKIVVGKPEGKRPLG
jgi:hypothetical protein